MAFELTYNELEDTDFCKGCDFMVYGVRGQHALLLEEHAEDEDVVEAQGEDNRLPCEPFCDDEQDDNEEEHVVLLEVTGD